MADPDATSPDAEVPTDPPGAREDPSPAEATPAGDGQPAPDDGQGVNALVLLLILGALALAAYSFLPFGHGGVASDVAASLPVGNDPKALLLQGRKLARTQGVKQALPYFQKAVQVDPHGLQANAAVGRALTLLDRFKEAVPYLQAARLKAPDSYQLNLLLGMALTGLERHEQARKVLERALELDPKNPQPLYYLGVGAMRLGDAKAMVRYFQPYVAKVPNPVALRMLADALGSLGRTDSCIAALTSLSVLVPRDVSVRYQLQDLEVSRDGYASVLKRAAALAARRPPRVMDLYLYGHLLMEAPGQARAARRALLAAHTQRPSWVPPLRALAEEDLRDGDLKAARVKLDQALQLSPGDADLQALLGDLDRQAGKEEAARKQYEGLLAGSRAPQAQIGILWSYLDEGRDSDAKSFVGSLFQHLAPGDPRRFLEVQVLEAQGHFDRAEAILRELLQKGRRLDRPVWLGHLAYLQLDRGDLAGARKTLTRLKAFSGKRRELPSEGQLLAGIAWRDADRKRAEAHWRAGYAEGPRTGDQALFTFACGRLVGKVSRAGLLAAARVAGWSTQNDALFVEGLAQERAGRREAAIAAYQEALAASRHTEFPARLIRRALTRLGASPDAPLAGPPKAPKQHR